MKPSVLLFIFIGLISFNACSIGQNNAKEAGNAKAGIDPAIEKAIKDFVKGGDEQNIALLETVLHPAFRVTVNQFMGSDDVTVLDRATYIALIQDKKMGGLERSFDLISFKTFGHTASAEMHMESDELIFNNFLSLIQDKTGKWWVLADAAVAQPKK